MCGMEAVIYSQGCKSDCWSVFLGRRLGCSNSEWAQTVASSLALAQRIDHSGAVCQNAGVDSVAKRDCEGRWCSECDNQAGRRGSAGAAHVAPACARGDGSVAVVCVALVFAVVKHALDLANDSGELASLEIAALLLSVP